MAKSKFKISEFTNPSGAKVWRLSGTLNAKRIRENYKSRSQAVSARQAYDIQRLNACSEGQTVWTTLTHEQNRDAIAAVHLLNSKDSSSSLSFAVSYFLENYRPPQNQKACDEAAMQYLENRQRDCLKEFISELQLKAIRVEMNRFKGVFKDTPISKITVDAIRDYLDKPKDSRISRGNAPLVISAKTWNNRRGILNTFYLFCIEKGYICQNPISQVPKHKLNKSRSTARTLTAAKAAEMMKFLETYTGYSKSGSAAHQPAGFLVPFFALTLFAGIRPDWKHGEICKLPIDDIDMKMDLIRIEPWVSKVNEKRIIKMQPNLKRWLKKYSLHLYPKIPTKNVDRSMREIWQKFDIGHDVLRHTYISMTVGAFRSVGDAALQAGNSEAVIRKHYLDLKTVEEAHQFWRIVPKGTVFPEKIEKVEGRFIINNNAI